MSEGTIEQLTADRDRLRGECEAWRERSLLHENAAEQLATTRQQLAEVTAEAARAEMHSRVAFNAAEAMTGAFERCKAQLAAMTAARDEACDIAESVTRNDECACATRQPHAARIATLRSIARREGSEQ